MKCVITGKETKTLTKNVPLSKEGRDLINELTDKYNEELEKMFIRNFQNQSKDKSDILAKAVASKVVKKVTKNELLQTIAVYSVDEVFEQFKEEEKEEVDE